MTQVHSELQAASSLHPKILTTIIADPDEQPSNCHLDVIYVLPASVFVDPYQLQDLESNLGTATLFGEHDLELPLEKVKEQRGSILFLRQKKQQPQLKLQLELPLHLRYQQPSIEKDQQVITIDPPYAGWTCGENIWPPISHPLITSYPPIKSSFIKLSHDTTPLTLSVPIGKVQDAQIVTYGTFGTVVLCTIWIARSVFVSIQKRRRLEAKGKRRKSE